MIINLNESHEIHITVNADGSCLVDFLEDGKRIGPPETWIDLASVIEEYC